MSTFPKKFSDFKARINEDITKYIDVADSNLTFDPSKVNVDLLEKTEKAVVLAVNTSAGTGNMANFAKAYKKVVIATNQAEELYKEMNSKFKDTFEKITAGNPELADTINKTVKLRFETLGILLQLDSTPKVKRKVDYKTVCEALIKMSPDLLNAAQELIEANTKLETQSRSFKVRDLDGKEFAESLLSDFADSVRGLFKGIFGGFLRLADKISLQMTKIWRNLGIKLTTQEFVKSVHNFEGDNLKALFSSMNESMNESMGSDDEEDENYDNLVQDAYDYMGDILREYFPSGWKTIEWGNPPDPLSERIITKRTYTNLGSTDNNKEQQYIMVDCSVELDSRTGSLSVEIDIGLMDTYKATIKNPTWKTGDGYSAVNVLNSNETKLKAFFKKCLEESIKQYCEYTTKEFTQSFMKAGG